MLPLFLHWCFFFFPVLFIPELFYSNPPFQISHPLLLFCKIRPNLHTEFSSLSGISILYFPGLLVIFTWLSQYSLKSIKLTLYFPHQCFSVEDDFAAAPQAHLLGIFINVWRHCLTGEGCYRQQVLRGQGWCGASGSTQDSPHNKEQSGLKYE